MAKSRSLKSASGVGIVIIGRNEAARLPDCLISAMAQSDHVVYVDSGSNDGSALIARSRGVLVVELEQGTGYSAARARNTGLTLLSRHNLSFIQFVDGDCVLANDWIHEASTFLADRDRVAIVVGTLTEQRPQASLWNRLCDLEWRGPVGEINTCGGILLARAAALSELGGFREDLIAGEEPELCVRLRLATWTIQRINAPMGSHDAAMTHLSQWWKRAVRGGHAYAEGAAIHGRSRLRHNVQQVRSTLLWGAVIPILFAALLIASFRFPLVLAAAAVIALLIGVQWLRIARGCRQRGFSTVDSLLYSTFCLLGKPAGAIGIARYWLNRLRGKRSGLIEYKSANQVDPTTSTT